MVAQQASLEPTEVVDSNQIVEEPVPFTAEDQLDQSSNNKVKLERELKRTQTSQNIEESKVSNVGTDTVTRPHVEASYVGWKQMSGWVQKDTLTLDDELVDLNQETILNNVLPDSLYGDWYHFVAIIFVAGILSFTFGYFKFSLAPVFFVLVSTGLLYRTNAKKYRASIRELIQKEFTVQKIEDDYETMDWLNNMLDKYWPIIEPNVSQMVVAQVNDQLATNPAVPGFIKSLWIDKFTLGIKPFRIDSVKTFQNTESDIVVMDWTVSFTPHDLSDMTAKQLKNYVNQKVVVKAKMFGITIPVAVSDISFKVATRVRFKLMTPFPHVETINVQLLEVPDIDFVCHLFGDNVFNWEILAIPGLYTTINTLAKKYMGPMFLPPFSLQLNIPQLLSQSNLSVGVLEITVKNAKDIKRANTFINDSVDPYLEFELSGKSVGKTRTVRDSLNPIWDETLYLLLSSFTDPLTITLFDKREKIKDKVMGRIEYNLNSMHDKAVQTDIVSHFLRNSKPVGNLSFDLKFFPTLERKVLPTGEVEELPDLNTGIAKIVVEELHGLNDENKKGSYYIEVFLNAKLVLTTSKVTSIDIQKFNQDFESVIPDRRKSRYRFIVKDSNTDEIVTSMVQNLNDLIDRTEVGKAFIPLPGSKAKLKVTTYWKPVRLDLGNNSIAYTPPIGLVRIYLKKAVNLKNLETVGYIDPYAKVLVNGISKGRTDYKSQTLNPVWNFSIYVAITSPNQKVSIEVMDVETVKKDRRVGIYDVDLSELVQEDDDGKYVVNEDDKDRTVRLVGKNGPSGQLTYNASFYPVKPILTLEEVQDLEKVSKRRKKLEDKKAKLDMKNITPIEKDVIDAEESEINELTNLYSHKQQLSLEELLEFQSGTLAISVLNGELPDVGYYVQAFFDGNGHSRFNSPKINSKIIRDGWTGDVAIKELKNSMTTFRVTKNQYGNRVENCASEVSLPTMELVKNCYNKPSIITLSGEGAAKLMIQVSWFPLDVDKLPACDLMSNSGDLTIISKSADNLMASDSNGFSDPYLKFYIDDFKDHLYETPIKKKTLNPVWNDTGKIEVKDRSNNMLNIKVMDWDAASSDDIIGRVSLPLSSIEPGEKMDMDLPVKRDDGGDGGMLHLSFEFEPRYVLSVSKREKKVGDVASKGLGSGLKVGTTVVSTGVGTIGKIGKGVFGAVGLKRKKSSKNNKPTNGEE
ncbi:similar to Saccharomyces cerevisiae YOR086C TCB1 Lipid-binding protein containing three calcium and lipid binding domains [Maudiozyma saulgeensis]|uniref:Similar to Saccharomyces cerevisiae YOR086C TCB1 Lipid-binding protein containing three calcium and lipid binding domains n=1 Tax=Maudiozyma saulgeensis TaxID=1789683 RepID=A0A1X7R3D7_9SACH|nr:similar to Saccharomyces cerevisiae YOR086C TCB1 Lipid-binding protein containing three calcium and lipid binding domains [Kazachstania saulgeensis]